MKPSKIAALLILPLALLVYLRSLQSWRPQTLTSYRGGSGASAVTFSPDGKLLATCGNEPDVSIWEVRTKRLVRKLSSSPARASHVAWSPDSRSLAASLDSFFNDEEGEVRLWDVQRGRIKRKWKTNRGMTGVAFSGDGKTIASSGWAGVPMWDAMSGKPKLGVGDGDDTGFGGVTLGRDDRVVISWSHGNRIVKWDMAKAVQNDDYYGDDLTTGNCAVFSPDGQTLAVGTAGRVLFYDARTWKVRRRFSFPQSTVTAITFSPDGKLFAAGSDNAAEIKMWNLPGGQQTRTLRGHSKTITSLSFAPNGETLASSSEDGTVRLWRLQ